jgi:hypothetical protein
MYKILTETIGAFVHKSDLNTTFAKFRSHIATMLTYNKVHDCTIEQDLTHNFEVP